MKKNQHGFSLLIALAIFASYQASAAPPGNPPSDPAYTEEPVRSTTATMIAASGPVETYAVQPSAFYSGEYRPRPLSSDSISSSTAAADTRVPSTKTANKETGFTRCIVLTFKASGSLTSI